MTSLLHPIWYTVQCEEYTVACSQKLNLGSSVIHLASRDLIFSSYPTGTSLACFLPFSLEPISIS